MGVLLNIAHSSSIYYKIRDIGFVFVFLFSINGSQTVEFCILMHLDVIGDDHITRLIDVRFIWRGKVLFYCRMIR